LRDDLQRLIAGKDDLNALLTGLLTGEEIRALWSRVESLLESGKYPRLDPHRNIPYGWW
jgi:hypothetical protein